MFSHAEANFVISHIVTSLIQAPVKQLSFYSLIHIHFCWVCIDTSVPPILGLDCNWGSQQLEKAQQHWKIAPGLLTAVHVKESRMSMFG